MATAIDPRAEQLVTSSDLVRHFGIWQDRAARQPVYVLHRGRPRFVLTSVELMDALCAPRGEGSDTEPLLDAVLDATSDAILIVDRDGHVVKASRAARTHFEGRTHPGAPIDAITTAPAGPLLVAAIARVIETGVADEIDIPSTARPGRTLRLAIRPCPTGAILCGHDAGAAEEIRTAWAEAAALTSALDVMSNAASLTLNLRGHIEAPGAALASLTGLTIEALNGLRFVTLIDIADRPVVAAAIDRAITDGTPQSVEATLLINRAAPRPVRIGLAPHRAGAAIDGLRMILVARAAG